MSSASEPNIKAVKDATLVSLVNSQAVSNNLVNYLKWNRTIKTSVVYQGEIPGDLISTWDPFDKTSVDVCIQEADIILSNTIKANEKMLVGFTPIRQEGSESYEYHVVLTGSGTFTFPEGTTSARAVLIGAGGAGFDGSPGGDSTETWEDEEIKTTRINLTAPTTSASDSSNVSNRGAGTPGNGGAGGAAGTPGKVYEVTFSPSSGSRISYKCGSKGASNGALGGETTFGSYSSNSGSTSSAGYTDIISGITYAKSGDSGADGGKGGSGADGESVGGVSGGKQEPSGSATRSDSDTQDGGGNALMDIDATANFSLGAAGGGGAGGNSGSNPGTLGSDAKSGSVRLSITSGYINAFVWPNIGGAGGNGADGANASVYGCSGSGGGGGGGAGGDSSASSNVSAQYYVYNITIEERTDFAINNNAVGAAVRKGGAGGKGGAGADGCIILYYGVTTPIQDGQLKDKNGLMLLDKYGRRLIV